ncbi:hypothetical protein [Propionivibrio sp.]|uniref:hypothetical protein n=1 Tax=Propionivibrio sp. TaxID=2212460 RepID=UPI002602D257|nr:hypothetical protein [Propionivibrio sp.]
MGAALHIGSRSWATLLLALIVACSWLAPLEPIANEQVEASLKRALISFATARALNAVISAAQGTEVAVQPAGVGINFAPGQILDPINDLVEQFAQLMLVASVALGVEKVLLTMGAHWAVSILLTVTAIAWSYHYLRQKLMPIWLSRLLLILLMTRFAIPLVTLGSDMLFHEFMADDYQSSQQALDGATANIGKITSETAPAASESGLLDRLKAWTSTNIDWRTHLESLKRVAEQTTERIIKLMVIFLLQTLILPLAMIWILWKVIRGVFEPPPRAI